MASNDRPLAGWAPGIHGDPLAALSDKHSVLRQQISATVLFADICGSTQLFEKYGDWQARRIESHALGLLSAKTVQFNGAVIKTIGDEIMSRFPDAEQGVKAACKMQEAIKNDSTLAELNIAIKIGLHYGRVLVERDDLFGDAVNVAARMVSQAKADQIITTRRTVAFLSEKLQQNTRNLGQVWVRGKQNEIELFEVLWQAEANGLTQLFNTGEQRQELRHPVSGQLVLEYRDKQIELTPSTGPFHMGRGHQNHLVMDQELVSRSHADIQFRQGKFILIDHSTNGTYLILDNGSQFFLRREEFILLEQGRICLGQTITEHNTADCIQYRCVIGHDR